MSDITMSNHAERSGSPAVKIEATSPIEIKRIAAAHPQTPTLQGNAPNEVKYSSAKAIGDYSNSSRQNSLSPEQQKIHRNHSFQLVRLQSEVSSLKAQREKDVKRMEALQDQMTKLYVDLANAKGVMGRMRIECHSRGHKSPSSSARNTPATVTDTQMNAGGNAGDILERVKYAKGDIEGLADSILEEQRPKLIIGLVSVHLYVIKREC